MRILISIFAIVLLVAPVANAGEVAHDVLALESLLDDLDGDRLFKQAKVGLRVVNVRTGDAVFDRNAADGLNPASTMKVVTAATALKYLGPSYKYQTKVYVDGGIGGDGVVEGNLYVEGGGDPHFVVERMWKLVQDLRLNGIEQVNGNVVFDESFFDADYALPGWTKQRDLVRGPAYFPSLGALSLNFNTLAIVARPGKAAGKPAFVALETPAADYVELVNEVRTGAAGSRRSVGIKREVRDGRMKMTVTGSIAEDSGMRRYYRAVADPTAHFMAAWMQMMSSHGITVTGKAKRGRTSKSAELVAQHTSPPLASILMDMNKYSNNFMAEQVLRTVGAEVKGGPGTTEKGLEAVSDYLQSLGLEESDFVLVNGSGLTRQAELSAEVLTAVLVDMASDPAVGHEFHASLAIAGLDGTLLRRLTDEPGRLRGKTGTIDGVHCLAGYVGADDGEQYAFAFMVNEHGGSVSQVKRLHDRFARKMFGAETESVAGERTDEE